VEELRRIREERGLSQADLAAASGVDRATINQVEGDRRSPTLATLNKLADALGVEPADLIDPKVQGRLFQLGERRGSAGAPGKVQLGDVLSERTLEDARAEQERLFKALQAGEIKPEFYARRVADLWAGLMRAAHEAAKESG
jgi:transcriptional regulator with XRE-family HTH domain